MNTDTGSIRFLCFLLFLTLPALSAIAGGGEASVDWMTVEIGDALVGGRKDSTVIGYLANSGSAPMTIDSMRITGADAASFRTLTPSAPFDIPAGEAFALRFRFSPLRTGAHVARLEAFSQGVMTSGRLEGNGVVPAIVATQDTIDFGDVPIGEFRDSVVRLVRNVSGSDVVIPKVIQDGFDVPLFTVTGGGPTTLQGGMIHTGEIRFAPTFIGTAQSRLRFEYNALGSPVQVILIGRGVEPLAARATLAAPVVSARVGDIVELPILLRNPRNLELLGITGFKASLRLNSSMLLPIAPTPFGLIEGEERVIPLDLPVPQDRDSILVTLRFRAIAGSDSTTALRLEDAEATGGDAAMLTVPGLFRMTGFCEIGGARLIGVAEALTLKEVVPNPADGAFRISFALSEDGPTTLALTDMQGRRVATLLDREMPSGLHTATIPSGTLPAGAYLCVLRTRTAIESIRLEIRE